MTFLSVKDSILRIAFYANALWARHTFIPMNVKNVALFKVRNRQYFISRTKSCNAFEFSTAACNQLPGSHSKVIVPRELGLPVVTSIIVISSCCFFFVLPLIVNRLFIYLFIYLRVKHSPNRSTLGRYGRLLGLLCFSLKIDLLPFEPQIILISIITVTFRHNRFFILVISAQFT